MTFNELCKQATTLDDDIINWQNLYSILTDPRGFNISRTNQKKYPKQVKAIRILMRKRTREKFLAWVSMQI